MTSRSRGRLPTVTIVYVFNKHCGSIDVLDSKKWPTNTKKETTRSQFHKAEVKEMARMYSLVVEAFYGKEECKRTNQPDWNKIAENPHYLLPAQQGLNECGVYSLKFACTFDGEKCVGGLQNYDHRSQDWKAENMFRVVFHEDNCVPLEDFPEEIQCLSPYSTLSTQGEELLLMLTQKED